MQIGYQLYMELSECLEVLGFDLMQRTQVIQVLADLAADQLEDQLSDGYALRTRSLSCPACGSAHTGRCFQSLG